jgi:hypothetical protein
MRVSVFVLMTSILASCTPFVAVERPDEKTVDDLVHRVQRDAREERWSDLYDLLSHRLQADCSRVAFVLGASSRKLPPPNGAVRIVEVIANGSYDGFLPDPNNDHRAIVFWSYARPGKPPIDFEVQAIREAGTWRIDGARE